MPETRKPVTRIDSAIGELKAINDFLATRCCQHAADTGEALNDRDVALVAVSARDKRIADLEAEIAALKAAPATTAEQIES